MNFTIPTAQLSAALTRCAAIAGTRSSMPILASVLLEPCVGVLKVTATDLETGYTTAVDGIEWQEETTIENHQICIPAKKLHECVKAIPTSEVTFVVNEVDQRVTISGGTVSFTLSTQAPEEFPALPEIKEGGQFTLDAPALVKILESVAYAQSKDDSKYHLCSCCLKAEANVDDELFLTAVGLDGHRLALDSVPLPGDPREVPADLAKGVIISTKGVAEICKIRTPGVIVLSIAANNLCIATDNEKLYLRLVDGTYPDWDRVIPKDGAQRIEVKRQALIDALERCRIMTEGKLRQVSLFAGDGDILVSADLASIGGHAEDRVAAVVPETAITLSINSVYLLDTLANMECSVIEISFKDELSALLINPAGTTEPLAVIMQMRAA